MTAVNRHPAQPTTGQLALVELRRHLLRQASMLAVRARTCRAKGDLHKAAQYNVEAGRLLKVAREMGRDQRAAH